VAVKTIAPAVTPGRTAVARFLREAEILRALVHPGIVQFQTVGVSGRLLFFVMEFVPGKDASRVLREEGALDVGRALRWADQVLDALAVAHARGFVHRDLKPANLLVTRAAGADVVKVADFGLARAYQASPMSGLTVAGTVGGTPQFMPPEQVLDFRSVRP